MDAAEIFAAVLQEVPEAVAATESFQFLARRFTDRINGLSLAIKAFNGDVETADALIAAANAYRDVLTDFTSWAPSIMAESKRHAAIARPDVH